MPTLIRLFVLLLVLAGLGYGGMVALTMVVTPKEREVSIRIPARELLKAPERAPVTRREINTNRTATPAPADATAAPALPAPAAPAAADGDAPVPPADATTPNDGPVKTLSPGVE